MPTHFGLAVEDLYFYPTLQSQYHDQTKIWIEQLTIVEQM